MSKKRSTILAAIALTLGSMVALAPQARGKQVALDVAVGQPILLAGQRQKAYLKIALTGIAPPREAARTPVNLAIVLDRSSSMSGQKIEKAKDAAIMVLDRLSSEDVVAIVTYDSTVEVLVPATKLTDREGIRRRIRSLGVRGNTALFAGVAKGIGEVRKFLSPDRFQRVILLSDGQANVGPSSPNELARLGRSAAKEGISVTTVGLGLGYNEDLMAQLALASDGNHAFAESATELAAIFDAELGDLLSVVARDVEIDVRFGDGVKPLQLLNRDATIRGSSARLALGQVFAGQEKFFLVEVEVDGETAGAKRELATVEARYRNMVTGATERLAAAPSIAFSASSAEVIQSENREVMVSATEAVAVAKNKRAVELRDEGKTEEAREILAENARELKQKAKDYGSKRLGEYAERNDEDASNLDDRNWGKQRKLMRKGQVELDRQQSY